MTDAYEAYKARQKRIENCLPFLGNGGDESEEWLAALYDLCNMMSYGGLEVHEELWLIELLERGCINAAQWAREMADEGDTWWQDQIDAKIEKLATEGPWEP